VFERKLFIIIKLFPAGFQYRASLPVIRLLLISSRPLLALAFAVPGSLPLMYSRAPVVSRPSVYRHKKRSPSSDDLISKYINYSEATGLTFGLQHPAVFLRSPHSAGARHRASLPLKYSRASFRFETRLSFLCKKKDHPV